MVPCPFIALFFKKMIYDSDSLIFCPNLSNLTILSSVQPPGMSARRLQQPAPISKSEYKWPGPSIVTTLAILPQGSGASLLNPLLTRGMKLPPSNPATCTT
eukprot:Blabericola_migrator_1__12716@NODE_814_length_6413_cov_62_691302_g574_i0_p6_GENE_NODE_814_length_6413_cov_62_691302_g574_i0NODE_814_length_6413_cov_62_691302_g574_i0_p6_ORF_typecomplete_len101_score2_72_NODE_814_length_6413_cov_62_691302_g574_i043324634